MLVPYADRSGVGVLSKAVFGHNVCSVPRTRGVEYALET